MLKIYLLSNLYIFWNLYKMKIKKYKIILIILYLILFMAPLIAYGFPKSSIGNLLGNTVNISNGIYIFILLFTILKNIFSLFSSKTKVNIIISLIITTSILSYGYYQGQNISIKKYEINLDKKSEINEFKAILITDIHLGYVNDEKYLEKLVKKINKINPDIVFISGDILDRDYNYIKNPEKAERIFKSIKSKYGVYGSLGNHDSGNTYNEMLNFFKKSDIKMVKEEKILIGEKILIVGRKDIKPKGYQGDKRKKIKDIVKDKDYQYPIIVLDHNPSSFKKYKEEDLILSGHTHSGQVFPLNKLIEKTMENPYGYYVNKKTGSKIVVSSGIGNRAVPIRLGTNVEIVKLNIKFK